MFNNFQFQETGDGNYRLVCPICGRPDDAMITPEVLSVLSWQHQDSVCIYCDKSAGERIPYTLADGGGYTVLTDEEIGELSKHPDNWSRAMHRLSRDLTRKQMAELWRYVGFYLTYPDFVEILEYLSGTCRITQSSAASGLAQSMHKKATCRAARSQKPKQ